MAEDQHNNAKLHAIYSALDTHNYLRALKLSQHKSICTWKITLALRCHILTRIGRKEECITLLRKDLLGYLKVDEKHDEIGELLLYLKRQKTLQNRDGNTSKGQGSGKNDVGNCSGQVEEDDLKKLDTPLTKTVVNAQLDPKGGEVLTDETTLATIALTLKAFQLNQTLIQMYTLAIGKNPSLHQDLYFSNLRLLMDPKYDNYTSANILFENMQTSAMFLARSDKKCFMWTAITALWRLEEIHRAEKEPKQQNTEEADNSKMKSMLPRLAESLANRVVKNRQMATVDDWKVFVQSLIAQKKYMEAIDALLDYNPPSDAEREETNLQIGEGGQEGSGVPPYLTTKGRKEILASLAEKAGDYERGVQWYEDLLKDFVDNWSYGSSMLKCAYESEKEDNCEKILNDLQGKMSSHRPIRGPHLLSIELIALRLRKSKEDETRNDDECNVLKQKIIQYVATFGGSATCCFSDVRPYLVLLFEKVKDKESAIKEVLHHFLDIQLKEKLHDDAGESSSYKMEYSSEKRKLRRYIVACQINLVTWSLATEKYGIVLDKQLLPNVGDMLKQWECALIQYKEFASGGGNQKEVLPGDDLILLAAFTILTYHSGDQKNPNLIINVIAILEHGLEQSPHNPQLTLFLLLLYSAPNTLNASSRALSLFQSLDIKQIQLDSLSYLFLQIALSSGLYTEGAHHCVSILGIHRSSATDVPNYAKKSMINGFYPVVEDMLNFQRLRMQRSVQLLEAKGFIMDFAPLTEGKQGIDKCLGYMNGLVGGIDDEARAMRMVDDANDFFGAPSIIKIIGQDKKASNDILASYADNRDFSVWNFVIGSEEKYGANSYWNSSKKILEDSFVRGHIHAILVRAVLITSSTKPPKKKKNKKNVISALVQERCKSLTQAVENAVSAVGASSCFWKIIQLLCTIITSLCANDPPIVLDEKEEEANTITILLRNALHEMNEFRSDCSTGVMGTSLADPTNRTAKALCSICTDLPSKLVPLYTLLETVRKLFSLLGKTKKKAQTKKEAEILAMLATEFKLLILDYKKILTGENFPKLSSESLLKKVEDFNSSSDLIGNTNFFVSIEGASKVRDAVNHIINSHSYSKQSIVPFLNHMVTALDDTEE